MTGVIGSSSILLHGSERELRRFDVACVTTEDELCRLETEWTALFSRVPDALPFQSFEWTLAWWAHLRRDAPWVHDALRVFVVRTPEGEPVAIAPMVLTTYGVLGIPLIRVLKPIGADPNITEVRGMLVRAEDEADTIIAIRQQLRLSGVKPDWVHWSGLRRGGSAIAMVRESWGPAFIRELSTFVLPLPSSWDEFRRTRPRNIRESLRKCYNSLRRDGHEWRFTALDSGPEICASLERFFDLHGRRAASDSLVSHPDYFASSRARQFLVDVVERLGRRGAARMFQLEVGGRIVAMRLGFRMGESLYLYYSGYDPNWGKYSVMTTVTAEAIRDAIESGASSVNLSTGADVSKTRWRPDEVAYVDAIVVSDTIRSRFVYWSATRLIQAARIQRDRRRNEST